MNWWNMSYKETRLGDGVKLLPLCLHAETLWRQAVWIRIVTSHNAWMAYEYLLRNLNLPRAIHKHNPHPPRNNRACVIVQLNGVAKIYDFSRWTLWYRHHKPKLRSPDVAALSIPNALIECSIDCPFMCDWPINVQCPQCLPQCMLYEIGFIS